ncbi:MAG: 30S ribosomal protein S16 [Bacillales bacterium]|jgi:small subunit ribosomal protein S16|nr:30S ribosomal protein S16 [Bacillales bacterium]
MVKIRLRRTGRTHLSTYRIVVSDSRSPRDGRFIEEIGNYEPLKKVTEQVKINTERVVYWLNQGAQPTQTVHTILSKAGILKQLAEEKKVKKA